MKNLFITLLFCTYFLVGNTQNEDNFGKLANQQSVRDELQNILGTTNNTRHSYGFGNGSKGLIGTPFHKNKWSNGKLLLHNSKDTIVDDAIKYKFDAYNNELWILTKKDSLIAKNKDIAYFEIENDKFVKMPKEDIGQSSQYFVKKIFSDDKIAYYLDIKKVIKPSNFVDKGLYKSGDPYDRIVDKHKYLLKLHGKEFVSVKNNTKDLIKALPNKVRADTVKYLKSNKMKGTLSENEIVSLLTYVSSIL